MIVFDSSETPDVTVCVLVTREPAMVQPSLEAVAAALPADVATEVVLVMNTTRDDTKALIRDGVKGARIITSPANCGTAVAWNVGFAVARGSRIALLHEDSHPQAGWLEALLEAAEAEPRALLVGSRLLNVDGSVWNGGWLVWDDAAATTIDSESAPDKMAATEPYLVDYTSSASCLVDRAGWQALGGFDERNFPAMSTEMDLAMAGWRAGRIAISTPHSVVIHARGAMVTSARGLYSGELFREFLWRRARKRLNDKWADQLRLHASRHPDRWPGVVELHKTGFAATHARAELPPPAEPPESRQSRWLSAPDGGWATELGPDAEQRLLDAQRAVDEEFEGWIVEDRKRLDGEVADLTTKLETAWSEHNAAVGLLKQAEEERDVWRADAEARAAAQEREARERADADRQAAARVAELEGQVAALSQGGATAAGGTAWKRLGRAVRSRAGGR